MREREEEGEIYKNNRAPAMRTTTLILLSTRGRIRNVDDSARSVKSFFFLFGMFTAISLICAVRVFGQIKDDWLFADILETIERPSVNEGKADNAPVRHHLDPPGSLSAIMNQTMARTSGTRNEFAPGRRFIPGSLSMSRKESIQRCYIGSKGNYEEQNRTTCVHVPEHNIIIYLQPKVGSSTLRLIMNKTFGENHTQVGCGRITPQQRAEAHYWVFTRDPFDRFISGYKEIVVERSTLYDEIYRDDKAKKYLPEEHFFSLKKELDTLPDEVKVRSKRNPTHGDVLFNTKLFEQFVQDYDGKAFDTHLVLQMSRMWSHKRGQMKMNQFDEVIEVDDLTVEMNRLAKQIGVTLKPRGHVNRRHHVENFINRTRLGDTTVQKLCKILARDYCCLNYELPDVCRKEYGVPKGEQVMCEWVWNEEGTATSIKHVLV